MNGKPLATIISAGMSNFGKREGVYGRELFAEAVQEAYGRCPNLNPKRDIKAIYVGQMSESFEHQGHAGPTLAEWAGLTSIQTTRIEGACASSGVAIRCGILAVLSGMADIVMVGGVEKMTHRTTPEVTEFLAMASDFFLEQWHGITFPGLFALMANAHMNRYGTTEEEMAMVSVKNHHHGTLNSKAHMQKEITLEQVMSSRVIAWPIKMLECALVSDGASCIILSKPEIAREFTETPVDIIGSGQASDTINLCEREDFTSLRVGNLAGKEAYNMAGIKPNDIDVAELHDCFTIAEIIECEDLGFCKRGKGRELVRDGITSIGGAIPINTSGGLKAKGHPVGSTGTAQAYEIYLQLTDQAEKRQVRGAKLGLSFNLGGSGATATVHIFKRR